MEASPIPQPRRRKAETFAPELHEVWAALYARQLPNVQRYACRAYQEGLDVLGLPADRIPTLAELNARITPPTGWRAVRTTVRYSDAVPWYHHFARRQFLITDYMRSWEELDFTPEPDMFHDIFGHLPFMALPDYTALQEMFAPAFLRADDARREDIKRLAWFSTEFGLIREDGEIKVFGAGLISSFGEIHNVVSGGVPLLPFTLENVLRHDKAIYSFNSTLFVIESLDALKAELARYFDAV
ncbi:MAG: amino acid hydroxylase [Chloroflexi bacterium]|nr:amino acid hydroxylase [Chloroflexota bacterium]